MSKNIKYQISNIKNKVIIKVEDTLRALGDIAKIYRERFDVPVVAISGSSGKTTTKEMLSHILSKEFNIVKARASFNNFVGVPLTLLEIKEDTQVVILEMETNLLGGITRLCEIAHPKVGIVTNIGDTHLESLQTKEGVYKEKSELIESLPGNGVAVLNSDDHYIVRMKKLAKEKKVITFGIKNKSDFRASRIKISARGRSLPDGWQAGASGGKDMHLEFTLNPVRCGLSNGVNDNYKVRLNTIFYNNVYNALAAVAISHSLFGLNLEVVIAKLREFRFSPMRMELINFKDVRIINDSYNANPQSMQEALLTLKNIKIGGRKIAVLGDMLELGQNSLDFHYQIGKLCAACQIDILVTVGDLARHIAKGAKEAGIFEENIFTFDNIQKTMEILPNILKPKDAILIKGSRKMRMEEIVKKGSESFLV